MNGGASFGCGGGGAEKRHHHVGRVVLAVVNGCEGEGCFVKPPWVRMQRVALFFGGGEGVFSAWRGD